MYWFILLEFIPPIFVCSFFLVILDTYYSFYFYLLKIFIIPVE
jgi:hypothetical protein